MKPLQAFAPWLIYASLTIATVPLSSVNLDTNLPIVPNRFIIEVSNSGNLPQSQSLEKRRPHDILYESLKKRGVGFDIDKEFDSQGLFVGAAVTLKDVAAVVNAPGVVAVRPVRKIQRPEPIDQRAVSGPNDPAIPPDIESTHIITGVDKLHAEGITGKGIKIGMLHPLLGGAFGPGNKVVGGFDFVGDNYNGLNAPAEDPDPLDECNGHGTHVAGIIGANPGNEYNISGVAYDASLSAYRVFGCKGFVSDDIIVAALLRGVKDNQDILTLSLGGADGWTESSTSVVASRIAASGKIVTIAAGNDGASGSWYSSSPGNGINVISVASVENTVIPLRSAIVKGVQHDPIPYLSFKPLPIEGSLPIYATSNNTAVADDACNPLPDSTPNLASYLVIVRRGSCNFVKKLGNIAAKGGKVALIYNNMAGFSGIDVGNYTAALIQAADGEFLVKQFVAGAPITVTFPQTGSLVNVPNPQGGLISSFSSYGPSNDLYFKPAVAAPGGNILSTLPLPLGGYGVQSGTSMATPFVAGSAGLLLQVRGKDRNVATGARTLFETTGRPVPSNKTEGFPFQTVSQQGAGLINVYDAIHYKTIVTPGELILNDTAHYQGFHTIIIRNPSSEFKTFQVSHVPAGTAETIQPKSIFAHLGPVPLNTHSADVQLSQSSVFLPPGGMSVVLARISPPKDVDPSVYPIFSGFITFESDTETLHVTYLGLAASIKDKQVVDNTDSFFGFRLPAVVDKNSNVQQGPVNYTFANGDVPTLVYRLAFGTPILRIDLVDANINFTPTLNTRGIFDDIPHFFLPHHVGGSFDAVPTLGVIAEVDWTSRNNEDPKSNGYTSIKLDTPTFSNGTTIPNGTYRYLLRALRVTGKPSRQEDYESWLSPIVGIWS
ncbi:hypothetical protein AMATHDRAFT_76669 [Amanita thiersii Skay4041]|uniref:Peptidase S8/S53 domain-containing protein n=1 Tax=Amanita thiersii Skay4041 TaxID=703135 RepID=A0A2A9NGW3_9AGAR|nr:hypothetical protein AMATHDRAFT_76669 [Amanita thiersii Skay4041]